MSSDVARRTRWTLLMTVLGAVTAVAVYDGTGRWVWAAVALAGSGVVANSVAARTASRTRDPRSRAAAKRQDR